MCKTKKIATIIKKNWEKSRALLALYKVFAGPPLGGLKINATKTKEKQEEKEEEKRRKLEIVFLQEIQIFKG